MEDAQNKIVNPIKPGYGKCTAAIVFARSTGKLWANSEAELKMIYMQFSANELAENGRTLLKMQTPKMLLKEILQNSFKRSTIRSNRYKIVVEIS